jgi:hypothetical protein
MELTTDEPSACCLELRQTRRQSKKQKWRQENRLTFAGTALLMKEVNARK